MLKTIRVHDDYGKLVEAYQRKKGCLHGEYKQYLEDGTISQHFFYNLGVNITDSIVSIVSDIKNITKEEALIIKLTYDIPLIGHSND